MKFLIDQPLSPALASWLRSAEGGGHDAVHARESGLSRVADEEIFARAIDEARIVVTADLDFSRIIALSGRESPRRILFRAGNCSDESMLLLLRPVLAEIEPQVLPRSVVVVDEWTIRIASLPVRPSGA